MLSENEILVNIAAIAVFGIGAQWIGRRLGFPSLLLLLPAGLIAGDVLGLVEPEKLLGDLLFPLVTLLVALLLFQSGMQLRFADLPDAARVPVLRLITIGLVVTFLGGSLAALAIMDIDTGLAFLLGAVVVVSGPTVVGPLLTSVRAREPTNSVLEYEGSFLDPLGATLSVVVLSVVLAGDVSEVHVVFEVLGRLGLGVAVGLIAAALLVFVMSRFLLTFKMEAAVAVMFAIVAFAVSDMLLSEAGLFATLTLGVAVANQSRVSLRPIKAFGGTLEVLIIGTLFILLGALVTLDGLGDYALEIVLLVTALVLVVRPISALISLLGTGLDWRDRALIGWVDPRGIVAASTAATFTGSLAAAKLDSDFLLPVVFGVILGTGVIYGLTAKPAARLLGVAKPPAEGVGLLGHSEWLLDLAAQLQLFGASVVVVTAKPPDLAQTEAESTGVPIVSVSDTKAKVGDAWKHADVGRVALCAPANVALDLLDIDLIRHLGRRRVLRLPDRSETSALGHRVLKDRSAHPFGPDVTVQSINASIKAGATVEVIESPPTGGAIALAAVSPGGEVNLQPEIRGPGPDDTVIGLKPPDAGDAAAPPAH
ncbi:MAG: cation:proton antiporter [Acidobacteriota bacterium]